MPHVVLLGDSVFDNAAYVPGEPDVVRQLAPKLPVGWQASLLAVDGAMVRSVPGQLARLPADASHLVVSVGGNDALGFSDVIGERVSSMAVAIGRLGEIARAFERDYRAMLQALLAQGLPTALCTIYNPRYPDPEQQSLSVTALTVLNDAILRVAVGASLPVIDLRLICTEDRDYANPIEPSARGGDKIADMIVRVVTGHDFTSRRSTIFA